MLAFPSINKQIFTSVVEVIFLVLAFILHVCLQESHRKIWMTFLEEGLLAP